MNTATLDRVDPGFVAVGGDATTIERLTQAADLRPDLAHLVPFWAGLYRAQQAARTGLAAAHPATGWELRLERHQSGLPQLTADDLPLAAEPVETLIQALSAVWRQHDPSRSYRRGEDWLARVRQVFADPTLTPGQRRELSFEDTLAALALVPYLEWAAAGVAPLLAPMAREWNRGSCPVCGGLPDLAVLAGEASVRSLVCSRCSTAWPYVRVGCPFCHDAEQQTYHASENDTHRLYVCPACRRYLKTVVVRRPGSEVDPRVERLVTIGMDLAALEAGYGPVE